MFHGFRGSELLPYENVNESVTTLPWPMWAGDTIYGDFPDRYN